MQGAAAAGAAASLGGAAPEFEEQKRVDAERYRRGEPHAMQTPYPGASG